jgi:hypothetical protein
VRNVLSDLTNTASASAAAPLDGINNVSDFPSATLADAIQRLSCVARDRPPTDAPVKHGEDANNILRIMSNLLTYPPMDRPIPTSPIPGRVDGDTAYHLLSVRRSTVSVRDASAMLALDRELAMHLVFDAPDGLPGVCRRNAASAHVLGRLHHWRTFSMLEVLLKPDQKGGVTKLAEKALTNL